MEGDLVRVNEWLLPLSWLYGLGVGLRNALYDTGLLKAERYDVPVVSVGNLTAGGTGKTPHVEYLIRLLSPGRRVAVLSRGYKRRSRGYVLASGDTPMDRIGDEPWQIKHKFPHVHVAVDADRRRGIARLLGDEATRDTGLILLDDAYQHRRVRPKVNILLVDYHRMVTDDRLLPAGRLREPVSAKGRADIIVVTKCPHDITPMGFRVIRSALRPRPCQSLFFSTLRYGALTSLTRHVETPLATLRQSDCHVLLLTGIGNPRQMEQDLRRHARHVTPLTFPDHHYYSEADARAIRRALERLPKPRLIVTTEKDATRLAGLRGLGQEAAEALRVLPVEVDIMRGETKKFNETITRHVFQDT